MTDEFERRQSLTSFITTLVDAVTRTSPTTVMSDNLRDKLEEAGLKDTLQAANKKWVDLYMHFLDKIDSLGSKYPIEELLGIKDAQQIKT